MANDDETLTFRLRAVAENMSAFGKAARGAEDVNAAMLKSQKVADALSVSNRKLTAARDKEADAAGRVRTAETKLSEVRSNANAKMSQIAAAEERLATARRNSSRATNDANKVEQDFKKLATGALAQIAQDSGSNAGKRFNLGFGKATSDGSIENGVNKRSKLLSALFGPAGEESGKRFSFGFGKAKGLSKSIEHDLASVGSDVEKNGSLVGRTFGTGILSGLEGLLKSEAGPYVAAGLAVLLTVTGPAIGAILAGSIVTAFGAGLVTLGIVFAAKSDAVKAKWKTTVAAMGSDMQGISQPFDAVLIHLADSMRNTLSQFAPTLKGIFANSAGPVQKFADDVLGALQKLQPALVPISTAFNNLLASLGPALQSTLKSVADGLTSIADSVAKNPNGLPDFIRGVGSLTKELLVIIGILNDANGAFERLTGGTSAVTALMIALQVVVATLLSPLLVLAGYINTLGGALNFIKGLTKPVGDGFHNTATTAQEAATATGYWTQGLSQAQLAAMGLTGAATGLKGPLQDVHQIAVQNATAASNAAKKFQDWIASMFDLKNEAIDVAQSQLDLKQAFADAAATITKGSANVVAARNKDAAAAGRVQVAEAQLAQLRSSGKATGAQLTAAEVRLADARRNAKVAADNLTKATAANSKGLDTNTQKGRDEYNALLRVARQANDTTEKMLRHKVALGTVATQATATKANFIKLAEEMGFNSTQAHKMAQDMLAIPNVKRTAKLVADTAAFQRRISAAQAQVDHMHGKTIPITYTLSGINYTLNTTTPSRVGGLAGGGKVSGPGSGTSDRAGLFALSDGEHVIRAASARRYGDQAMYSVNNGTATIIPGMAAGGGIDIHGTGVFKNAAQLRSVLGKQLGPPATSTPGGGAGVQRWRGVALAALAAAHEPASWIGSLLSRMQRESGGNPRAINLTDINAQQGDPSKGLMQTILPTFDAYAGPYRSRGIYDPFANIYAAIKYTVARYGSGPAGWNRAGGYKNGGWLMPGQTAYNETRQPEAVFNRQQLGQLGNSKVVLEFRGDGSPYMAFLVSEFKKYVRVHGGDVQKVIGSRG